MTCKCGSEIKKPYQTSIIIRDGCQVVRNEYRCDNCSAEHIITRGSKLMSSMPTGFNIDFPIVGDPERAGVTLPFDASDLPVKCKFCGSESAELEKVNVVKFLCRDKTMVEDNVYLCNNCKRTYHKKIAVDNNSAHILKSIMSEFPETLKKHIESEVS